MSIIQRLIVKRWVSSFTTALSIYLVMLITANILAEMLRGHASLTEIVLKLIFDLPGWFSKILPIACLSATLFSLHDLREKNELLAIFAGGFKRREFIGVLVVLAICVASLQFLNVSFIDPWANKVAPEYLKSFAHKFRLKKGMGLKESGMADGQIWYKSKDYFLSFATFDKTKKQLHKVSAFYYTNNFEAQKVLLAEKAIFVNDHQWEFQNIRFFNNLNEEGFPSIIKEEKKLISLNETPADFKQIEADITKLNFFALFNYIKNVSALGLNVSEYLIIFYNQLTFVLICFVFTFLPIEILFNPNRRDSSFGKNAAFVFIHTILFWLIHSIMLSFGTAGKIPPLLGTTLTPSFYILFIIYLFLKNRKFAT